jgi:small-conductance mechanosensitive channel
MSTDELPIDYLSTLSDVFKFEKILLILLGISALIFLSRGIKAMAESLYNKIPTKKTLIFQISTMMAFFLNIFGSFYIFYAIISPPREFLIAILGSITFASGLAIKDLVSSIISGITIIIDPPFQVGDRIRFKDIYGEIKHIGLRAIKVQNLDNQIITIPNQNFLNDMVLCANSGSININVVVPFYVAIEADLEKAKSILREIVITSRFAYLNEPILMAADHVWRADVLCIELILKAHTMDASFEKEFKTDIITRANKVFIEENIPFPKSVGALI